MAGNQSDQPARRTARAAVSVLDRDDDQGEFILCSCCEPANPLVMRPDLGTLADGSSEYALCVLHQPEPVVYRNRGDGEYVQMPKLALSPLGDLVDDQGNVVARVTGDTFQRLTTVDDDDEPPPSEPGGGPSSDPSPGRASRPRTYHVDLTEDDFYRTT